MFNKAFFLLAVALISSEVASTQQVRSPVSDPNLVADSVKGSVYSRAVLFMGSDSISITYHSPAVRRRIIWGGLVPYGEIWVTGAHNATLLETSSLLKVAGKDIPAGRYALFTIPGLDEWIVIFNKNWNQHLAWDYDSKDDLVRFTVKPKQVEHLERLQYFISAPGGSDLLIRMHWEKVMIELPIAIK